MLLPSAEMSTPDAITCGQTRRRPYHTGIGTPWPVVFWYPDIPYELPLPSSLGERGCGVIARMIMETARLNTIPTTALTTPAITAAEMPVAVAAAATAAA